MSLLLLFVLLTIGVATLLMIGLTKAAAAGDRMILDELDDLGPHGTGLATQAGPLD